MIGTLAFVLGFVALGVTVVFLALRGGPRGAREALHTQSHAGRRFVPVVMTVLTVGLGLAVPAIIMADNEESLKKQGPGGVDLSNAETNGRQLFARNCSTCHTLKGADAVGKVGPNLDTLNPPVNLTLDAIKNGRARGMGQMPAELLDGNEAKNVAQFIAKVAGR